jgi:hypothetical protein
MNAKLAGIFKLQRNWLGGRVRGTKAIIFRQTKRGFAGRSSATVKKSRKVGREMSLLGPNGDPPNQLHSNKVFPIFNREQIPRPLLKPFLIASEMPPEETG